MPPINPASNANVANAATATSAADLGTAVFKRLQFAAAGVAQKTVPFGPAARKATGGGMPMPMPESIGPRTQPSAGSRPVPMPQYIGPKTRQGVRSEPVPMPTYLQGIGSLLPVRDVAPGFIDKSARLDRDADRGSYGLPEPSASPKGRMADPKAMANGPWFKPQPGQPSVKPSAPQTSPTPSTSSNDSRITSHSDLNKLNPKFSLDQAKRLTSSSYQMFGAKSSFAQPIPDQNGYLTTKPIAVGAGLTLPVGTKISGEWGLTRTSALIQPGRPAAVEFELPNGKRLSLQGSFERTTGRSTMQITFADGKKFELPGAPFFNPQTGELGRVTRVFGTAGNNANPSYRLQNTLFNSSAKSAESINGEMNGVEAQKSLADTLK
jgi:hypothetical protein